MFILNMTESIGGEVAIWLSVKKIHNHTKDLAKRTIYPGSSEYYPPDTVLNHTTFKQIQFEPKKNSNFEYASEVLFFSRKKT